MIEPPGELSHLTAVLGEAGRAPTDAAKAAVYRQLLEAVLIAPLDPASTDERAVLLVERKENGRLELPAFSCRSASGCGARCPPTSPPGRPTCSAQPCSRASTASCSTRRAP